MENNVDEEIDTSTVALMDLDFYSLEAVFMQMPSVDLYRVARTCTRFRDICVAIWRRDSKNLNCISGPDDDISFIEYKFYICAMAKYLEQLRLYTSDIAAFSIACQGHHMRNLIELRIVHVYDSEELPAITFLPQCRSLQKIDLCQPILEVYKSDVLNLPNIHKMEIVRITLGFDELMQEVIFNKRDQLIKLDLPVDYFPPCWLTSETMQGCQKLEELIIETRFAKIRDVNLLQNYPFLPSVCSLKIIGTAYHDVQIRQLVSKLPNLRNLTLYYCKGVDIKFLADISFGRLLNMNNPIYCQFYTDYQQPERFMRWDDSVLDDMNRYYSKKNLADFYLDPRNLFSDIIYGLVKGTNTHIHNHLNEEWIKKISSYVNIMDQTKPFTNALKNYYARNNQIN